MKHLNVDSPIGFIFHKMGLFFLMVGGPLLLLDILYTIVFKLFKVQVLIDGNLLIPFFNWII